MKDTGTMSLKTFFLLCGINGAAVMVCYQRLLFRTVPGLSPLLSCLLLGAMLALSVLTGGFLVFRHLRNGWTSAVSALLPFGWYAAITYIGIADVQIKGILVLAAIAAGIFSVRVMSRTIRNPQKRKKIVAGRIHRCIAGTQSFLAVGMAVLLISLGLKSAFEIGMLNPSVQAVKAASAQEQTIAGNMDTLLLLRDDKWEKLSAKEKLDVLQTAANIEASHLHLPSKLYVTAAKLPHTTLGKYSHRNHRIYLNIDHLERDRADAVLLSLLHESQHSEQFRLAHAYQTVRVSLHSPELFRKAAAYAKEFENYVSGDTDALTYYRQQCETDARTYAAERESQYSKVIREYEKTHPEDKSTEAVP